MKYLLVLFFVIVYEIDARCPNGTFSNDAGDKCYFIPKNFTQFLFAETSCQDQNGNLVSISNSFENAFLQDIAKQHILGSNATWIGGSKINGTWIWSDGQNFTYTNWAKGNPKNNNYENCIVLIFAIGQWYSVECNNPYPYICELSQTTTTITNSSPTTITSTTTKPTTSTTTITPLSTTDPKHSNYRNLLIFSCAGIFIFIFAAFMLSYCILRYREKKRRELLAESLGTGFSSNIYS